MELKFFGLSRRFCKYSKNASPTSTGVRVLSLWGNIAPEILGAVGLILCVVVDLIISPIALYFAAKKLHAVIKRHW